jgi:hypothetical protein
LSLLFDWKVSYHSTLARVKDPLSSPTFWELKLLTIILVQTIIAVQMKVWAPKQILAVFTEVDSGDLFSHNIGEIPLTFSPVGLDDTCCNCFSDHMERDSNVLLREVCGGILCILNHAEIISKNLCWT